MDTRDGPTMDGVDENLDKKADFMHEGKGRKKTSSKVLEP